MERNENWDILQSVIRQTVKIDSMLYTQRSFCDKYDYDNNLDNSDCE